MPTFDPSVHTVPLSEQFVLACVLRHPGRIPWLTAQIGDPRLFYTQAYRRIFDQMLELVDRGLVPDLASLGADATAIQQTELLDILATLHDELFLQTFQPQSQLETHVQLMKEAFVKREMAMALERGETAEVVLHRLEGIAARGQDRVMDASTMADLVYGELTEKTTRVSFPFRRLNFVTAGGMRPGELVIVAARQSGGKSAFLQNMALHHVKGGGKILFVTGEMSGTDLGGRWATILSGQQILRYEGVTDMQAATRAIATVHEWQSRMVIHELTEIAGIEQTIKDRGPFDVIFVDYLQKLTMTNSRPKSEYERVSGISRHLDNLCQRYQVPIVAAAQFNRRAEGQQPSIADLRDSGQIEADADLVISLWQKPEEQTSPSRAKIYLDVLKNRNGATLHNDATHEYALWLNKPVFTFSDMETDR